MEHIRKRQLSALLKFFKSSFSRPNKQIGSYILTDVFDNKVVQYQSIHLTKKVRHEQQQEQPEDGLNKA